MNDVAVRLEHVDLLDGLDVLHVHLLERGLQLLVVRAAALMNLLHLPSGCALAAANFESVYILLFSSFCHLHWLFRRRFDSVSAFRGSGDAIWR